MKIRLEQHHRAHLRKIGHRLPLWSLKCTDAEYKEAAAAWKRSGIRDEAELHKKVVGHLAWKRKAGRARKLRWFGILAGVLLVVLFAAVPAHCQFSHIETITATDGTNTNFAAAPFKITFSGCTVGGTGTAWTITCTGVAGNPGGSANQLQFNNAGTSFNGITNKAVGFFLGSAGATSVPTFQPKGFIDPGNDYAVDCTGVGASDTAITNAVAAGNQVILPEGCIVNLAANHTFASTVTFTFYAGAELAPQSGVSLIFNGPVNAGNRQQIVNTTNGTVQFYGTAEIPCGWYGSLQDLVHDDAPGCEAAHNANPGKFVFLVPINPHCKSGTIGGGCISNGADALFLSQFLLHANGSSFGFKGVYHKVQDGGAWISVPNALGAPAVFVGPSCVSCSLSNLIVQGPAANGWNGTNLTTFMLYSETALDGLDNDGITIAGGHFRGTNIGATNFLRHGIFLCGDNTCPDGSGQQSAVDYGYIDGCSTIGNRGFGVYDIGGDGGAFKTINCGSDGDGYGSIGDWVGAGGGSNLHIMPGDETSAHDAILAGTTQAVTSISVAGTTCTLTTTAALANGVNTNSTWIVVAGSTGGTAFNGTFQVTSFNNVAQTLTYPCTATGGPASGGTVGTSSSRNVWNYLATVYSAGVGVPITPGWAYTTGAGNVIFIAPYCEPSGYHAGSSSTIIEWGNCSLGQLVANQLQTAFVSGSNGLEFGLPSTSGLSAVSFIGLQDAPLNVNFQQGETADQSIFLNFYSHPPSGLFGSVNWFMGQYLGSFFRMAGTGGDFLRMGNSAGTMGISATGTGDVTFGNTNFMSGGGSGNVTFFGNSTSQKAEIFANGSAQFGPVLFANLGTPANGVMVYCSDCKNVADDSVTFDSTATGSGHGTNVLRENGVWRVH